MIVKMCKLLFKISLLIAISSPLTSSKSIEKRQTYQQYQQPYYHQSAVGNQEYIPPHNQQYQPVSENQYQQDQIEHINQQLKHQFRGQPQSQAYYNQGQVQNYQQSNYNQNQLNGRYINQYKGQHPVHFEDHYLNTEENYKQNRRHTNEDVQQQNEEVPQEQTEVKEEKTKQHINTEKDSIVITEKPDNSTKKDEEIVQKGSDKENEISGELLKQTKNEEDCKSEEYLAAKHAIEEIDKNKEDCKSEEFLAAKPTIEEQGANKEDCKSEEYLAAKQALEEINSNKEDCKSKEYLEAKHITDKNEVIDKIENGKEIISQPNQVDDELVKDTNGNIEKIHHDLDPHLVPSTGDNTRNERTIIGRLHETDDPRKLIDNFRNKLKMARSNIEQMELANLRKADPRAFVYNPNLPKIPHIYPNKFNLAPVVPNYENKDEYHLNDLHNYRQSKFDELNGKSTAIKGSDAGKIITSPITDDSFSDSSEEKKTEDNKTTVQTEQNNAKENTEPKDQKASAQEKILRFSHRNSPPEEITQLLHVRDEINRIRSIMQTLKEHEMKQKYGPSQSSRNLTDVEQKELKDFIDKLKKDGKISTTPLKPQNTNEDGIQSNPPEVPNTNQLIEDIGKLKKSIQYFAKNIGIHKGDSTEANLEKLEEQIGAQKHEIENLKKLIEDLLPPTDFPSTSDSTIIKHPELEKHHLHHELQALQATLNDLLNKEEMTLKTAQTVAESLHARASDIEPKINSKETSEKEIGTLVKILHTVQHPENDKNVLAKLEQISHDIKKLDIQNQRARQELLLEKLEREAKNLRDLKVSSDDTNEELTEKQKRLKEIKQDLKKQPKEITSQLEKLQKEIEKLSKPMGKELDSNIENELDKLQKQIENLGNKNDNKPASGRQLEGLLSDILSNAGDNSIENHETSGNNLLPHSILNAESHIQAPIFQIPYCLQKHPNYAIYQDASNFVQPGYKQTYQQPEKQQQLNTNYNGPQPTYKYIPQPQQVIIQPVQQQFQPQRPIYLPPKPVPQLYQPPKPIVHQVYEPKRPPPPVYAPSKIYSPQKPIKPLYESVKPINVEVHQGYSPSNYNVENQYKPNPNIGNDQKPCGHSVAMEDEIKKLNSMLSILNEKIEYNSDSEPENYDVSYRSKNSKTRTKREVENVENDKQQLIREIRERLADLREQVQTVDEPQSTNTSAEQTGKRSAYYQTDHQHFGSKLSLKKKQKFDDLFIKVIKFILHKLEISAPYVIESLFNGEAYTYEQDYDGYNNNDGNDYNNGYRSNQKFRNGDDDFDNYIEDNDESNIQNKKPSIFGGLLNNFQGLFPGLLGFIPNILLKLLSNFSSFLKILKRNKFFKNFLFPGALILVIDGIMALLIWWFSDDDTQNLFDFNINNELPNVQNNRYL